MTYVELHNSVVFDSWGPSENGPTYKSLQRFISLTLQLIHKI